MHILETNVTLYAAVNRYGSVYVCSIAPCRQSVVDFFNNKYVGAGGWQAFLNKEWQIKPVKITCAS
jgi:hypothetical protein